MKPRFLFVAILLSVTMGLLAQAVFASDNEKDSKMEGGQICQMIAVDSIEDGCVIVYVIDSYGIQLEKGMDVSMIGNGKKYTVEPNEDGDFEFKNLSSGEYTVSVKIKNGDYYTSRRIKMKKKGKILEVQINKQTKD